MKCDHISRILKELPWLAVKSRIEFKILISTSKAYHETGPKYSTDSNIHPGGRCAPLTKNGSVLPKYNLESYGKRTFSVSTVETEK